MMGKLEAILAREWVTRGMAAVTALLVVLTLVVVALTIPDIASNTEASRRTDDLAACRAQSATAVNDATLDVLAAQGEVLVGIADGIVAAIRQDPTTLDLVAADIETAQAAYQEAVDALAAATDRRAAAIDLSQNDPDLFLDQCKGSSS